MKGNEKVIEKLNSLLADELTAINQYIVHSEMCGNWHYEKLHKIIRQRSIGEMKHAERLIERILYLDGQPVVSVLNKINIGAQIEAQLKNDLQAEYHAVSEYNLGIRLAVEMGDNGTRDLLQDILTDEEEHVDWLEAQLEQIKQMGLQNYLADQTE